MGMAKLLAFLLIPAYAVLIAVLEVLKIQAVFEPPLALPILNTVFLGILPVAIAFIAGRVYQKTGAAGFLFLGSGMLVFGLCSISAGWLIGLPGGPNITVTIYNTGVLRRVFSYTRINVELSMASDI